MTTRRSSLVGSSLVLMLTLVLASMATPVRIFAAPSSKDELPARFHVIDGIAPRFLDLLAFSPTFRSQCQRIVDAEVRVVVETGAPWDFDRQIRAKSQIVRDTEGRVRFVRVKVRPEANLTVVLPHEMEHVLEQIDGVDLVSLAKQRNGGAWRASGHAYETTRAEMAGRRAEQEYRTHTTIDTMTARQKIESVAR